MTQPPRQRFPLLRAAAWLLLAGGVLLPGAAAHGADLDFSTWRALSVFDRGRRKPLESFANVMVREISGQSNPVLGPGAASHRPGGGLTAQAARAADEVIFPDGRARRFTAPELLLSWLIEPEVWEYVPFLAARHEELRTVLLDLPLRGRDGSRLKHVSPAQLIEAEGFRRRLRELSEAQSRARQEGRDFPLVGVDRHVNQLYQAYALYRLLTYDPAAEVDVDTNRRFGDKLVEVHNLWIEAAPRSGHHEPEPPSEMVEAHQAVRRAFEQLAQVVHAETFTAAEADPLVVAFREACDRFATLMEEHRRETFAEGGADEARRTIAHRRAAGARNMAAAAEQLHRALYDVGRALRLAPGLDPEALRADRDVGDQRQPWLSVQALIHGSDALLAGMPREELRAMREAFADVETAYTDRRHSQRRERFAEAMDRLAAALRALGEAVEPIRESLDVPGDEDDRQRLLAATAYPPPGYHWAELHYNWLRPFLWTWVVCLLATVCTAVSYGLLRKMMFWSGVATLIAAQGIIVYALALRTYITGYVAVTNMFETVVFVALTVAMFGVWFALLPLLWPGIVAAWRLTALPPLMRAPFAGAWRALGLARRRDTARLGVAAGDAGPYSSPGTTEAPAADERPETPPGVALGQWLLLPPQLAMMAALVVALTMMPYGSGGRAIFLLLPHVDPGQSLPTMSNLLAWTTGLAVLVPTVWLTPRVLFAAALALGAIPLHWKREQPSAALAEVYSRRLLILVGAAVGFLAAVIAYHAPILDRDIQALQPILRDNFWLTMHVLSITASYGAGALAWGLANVVLGYYLFGRYRDPAPGAAATGRQPPQACARLSGFIYRALQVAVLLLAVGTVLGALWADVAWGRFWSWDAKEVWSLICILVYMAILHGRYIGFGNFGLAAGAVLGMSSIMLTWYGVNYMFGSGLHSYGGGTGGQYHVIAFIVLNLLFLFAAGVRYLAEK